MTAVIIGSVVLHPLCRVGFTGFLQSPCVFLVLGIIFHSFPSLYTYPPFTIAWNFLPFSAHTMTLYTSVLSIRCSLGLEDLFFLFLHGEQLQVWLQLATLRCFPHCRMFSSVASFVIIVHTACRYHASAICLHTRFQWLLQHAESNSAFSSLVFKVIFQAYSYNFDLLTCENVPL